LEKLTVDTDLCDGCLDCVHTCEGLYESSRISIHSIGENYYPIVCQHCDDAPCKTICPTDAMDVTGVNKEKCIACGFCVMVCPFGAVEIQNKSANKCDLCKLSEDGPGCVKACSKRAIYIADPEIIKKEKQNAFLNKLAGVKTGENRNKSGSFINLITSSVRTAKVLNKKE
jgi:carbon-monoxide dehydrogenase iron sulfur subunit